MIIFRHIYGFILKQILRSYPLGIAALIPITLVGQNQPPVAITALTDQILVQGGEALAIDLKSVFDDPDVSDPAVQFDVRIGDETKAIHLALLPVSAPLTVANFIAYIEAGYFDNNLLHRSVPGFIIQGGAFNFAENLTIGDVPSFDPVKNEPGISNTRGTVSMAKLGGDPNSATSSWFINLANNALDLDGQNGGFTVFADVIGNGMAVADEIASLPVYDVSFELGSGAFAEMPLSAPNLNRSSFVETTAQLIFPVRFSVSSSNPSIATADLSSDGQLTIQPSVENAGETTITITASDLDGATIQESFTVMVEPLIISYDQWQEQIQFPTAQDAIQTGDPDKDGLINLFEFTFGTNPLEPTETNSFIEVLRNGDLQLSFTDKLAVTIQVESSIDLKTWTPIWTPTDGATAQPLIEYVTVEDTVTVVLRTPKPEGLPLFWRTSVNEPDN
jgi:cyclophilin family peptidyl-prolyl cis-trans isomerase